MNYLTQVQKGIDFIEAHLDEEVTLKKVAQVACISQWHFQRIFKALTKETLKTYIRSRRLANSMDKLLTTNERIIDIAISSGYESQQSFTRAFKQSFNLTPNLYRKLADESLFIKKAQFNGRYLRHINRNISLLPEILTQNSMKLVGMKTNFYSSVSENNNSAQILPPLWKNFLNRKGEIDKAIADTCYGIVQHSEDNSEQLEYYAVIAVNEIRCIPKGMVSIEIPAARYAKFTHKGSIKDIDNTINYIYSSWLLQSDYVHTYGADLEFYTEKFNPHSDQSEIYYAIPIK